MSLGNNVLLLSGKTKRINKKTNNIELKNNR